MPLHSAETLGQGLSFMSEVAHGLQVCKEEGDLSEQIVDPGLRYGYQFYPHVSCAVTWGMLAPKLLSYRSIIA